MATNYFAADINFTQLQNLVLRELHEPDSVGSEAVPLQMVQDKINEVYFDVFNDMRIKQTAREKNVSFNVVPDDALAADAAAGATAIVLNSSDNFRTSGKVLLQSEIVTYSANTVGTETLTCTALNIAHTSGEVVRQMYLLTDLGSDIDDEQIQYISVNGIPFVPQGFDRLLSISTYTPFSYAVYQGYLLLARAVGNLSGNTVGQGLMVYSQKVTKLTATTDTPTLIPNAYRIPLLVYGACMRIAAADAYRTSWDWWDREYQRALAQYIAHKNTRTKDRSNRSRPSLTHFNY